MRQLGAIAARAMFCLTFAVVPAMGQTTAPLAPPLPPLPPPTAATPAEVPALQDSLTGQAKVDYLAGRMLYEDGDAKSAQVKFQSAYDQSKDARLLWNVAACAKQQRRYAEVESLVQRYLAEGGALIAAEDRTNAMALLEAIQPFLASATVVVNEPGASVFVDGELVGKSPFAAPVRIQLGVHKIRIEKSGFKPDEQTVDVKGGSAITVSSTLVVMPHEGELRVFAGAGERISVDGKPVGVGTWTGKLPSGNHTVEVTGDNKLPYRSSVVIADDQVNSVRAALEAQPEEKSAIPGWVWWVGGAVVLAGGGVGGYFLLKPDEKKAETQPGTLEPGVVTLNFR